MMRRSATISAAALNLWALDFGHNLKVIQESIRKAKEKGARYRTGPELEISGYDCGDHFFETDTLYHSWEVLVALLKDPENHDIILDVGMPVDHRGVLYNCRVILFNGKLVLIRPKIILCDNETYSETRWFTAWTKTKCVEDHPLPELVREATGQQVAPFGDALVETNDTCIGFEICEELWNPASRHIEMGFAGAEIFVNSSGDVMSKGRASEAIDLAKMGTLKGGGCYVYTNLKGSDGDKYFYRGNSFIVMNGELLDYHKMFQLSEVDVLTSTVDLEDIKVFRYAIRSRCLMGARQQPFPITKVAFNLCADCIAPTPMPINPVLPTTEQDILEGSACYLWDYLRRSNKKGFVLPLSDNISSIATAVFVYSMCQKVFTSLDDETVKSGLLSVLGEEEIPECPASLCGKLLNTLQIEGPDTTEEQTKVMSALPALINSNHHVIDIGPTVEALSESLDSLIPSSLSSDSVFGNCDRIRSAATYCFAKNHLPGEDEELLVLGPGSVEHWLTGDCVKYGSHWADVSITGGISVSDLQSTLRYASARFELPGLLSLLPNEDLELHRHGLLSYSEIAICGKLRKLHGCGPYSMFLKLMNLWGPKAGTATVSAKVKEFFREYSLNRHKIASAAPALRFDVFDSENGRADFRPFIYSTSWSWQFQAIDRFCKNQTNGS